MKKLALVLMCVGLAGIALAGTVAGNGGATEVTQLLNQAQLVLQYEQQVQGYVRQGLQLQYEFAAIQQNPFSLLGSDVGGIINDLGKIMSGANQIAGGMAQIDSNFATKFQSPTAATYSYNMKNWHDTSTKSLDDAMSAIGRHRADYASDTAAIQAVYDASKTNLGERAALDTLRDMNYLQLQQSRKLGEMLASQAEASNTYMALQNQKEQLKIDTTTVHFQPLPITPDSAYHNPKF
ncbi:hypothetical protein GALL_395080 [mine drainage metagenome]|uniref:P-type conjugative transfer protein TrbJ n=1 Tax=mine drainage metagenome TaxID=410659 RepID=A0A1J5Q6G9_9ZZZZ